MKQWILLLLIVLLLACNNKLSAQQITGKVVDAQQRPVETATVIAQTPDSVFVDATLTDSLGVFRLKAAPGNYRLIIQHLLFESKQVMVAGTDAGTIALEAQLYALDEVVVKADRPIVKVEDGRLSYDVPQLTKDKTVTNAYEALKELPGVMGSEDELTLAGAGTPQILINGQLTTLSYAQVVNLLKSTPASKVKKAEVMYSAPPQYNVRGALINVVLEDNAAAKGNTLQGEVGADYRQRTYASGGVRGNVVWSTPTFSLDVLYNLQESKRRDAETMTANHTLQGAEYLINQENGSTARNTSHVLRVATSFTGKQKDRLSLAYTGNYDSGTTQRFSETTFNGTSPVHTDNRLDGPSALHNVKVEYNGHKGLVAGADYTYYDDTSNQHLTNTELASSNQLRSVSEQHIHRGMLFANQTHALPHDWKLNYGGNFTFSHSSSFSDTYKDKVLDPASSFSSTQKEVTGNVFVGFTKSFTQAFSVQASLSAEYYKCTENIGGEKIELWNNVALFPNVNATYVFSPKHVLQFSLSSDKKYPGYWAINPTVYYLNVYSEVYGNPELKPSRNYSSQLTYIWRQKYVLMGYYSRTVDYFTQLPYQSPTELKNVFQTLNFDFREQLGVAMVIPFKVKDVLNSRLTLNGLQIREKASHFHDVPFDRKKFFAVFQLNNTINLSNKPNLKMDINGSYITPAQQGIYDLTRYYEVNAGLKWTSVNEKAQLSLRGNDIFRTGLPNTIVDYKGQRSRMQVMQDTQALVLSFTYKFGGFKKAKEVNVDTSRFGR